MIKKEQYARNDDPITSALYVLKHKDLDVAMVQIDRRTGKIEYILEVYLPEEIPVGCSADGKGLDECWEMRAIPKSASRGKGSSMFFEPVVHFRRIGVYPSISVDKEL
ncbi:MAG: hypothetical protein HFG41_03450 [Coprococcus sp.]|nr:hypothetical protein [Coprococcus sp.]